MPNCCSYQQIESPSAQLKKEVKARKLLCYKHRNYLFNKRRCYCIITWLINFISLLLAFYQAELQIRENLSFDKKVPFELVSNDLSHSDKVKQDIEIQTTSTTYTSTTSTASPTKNSTLLSPTIKPAPDAERNPSNSFADASLDLGNTTQDTQTTTKPLTTTTTKSVTESNPPRHLSVYFENFLQKIGLTACCHNYCKYNLLINLLTLLSLFGTFNFHKYETRIHCFDNSVGLSPTLNLNSWSSPRKNLMLIFE